MHKARRQMKLLCVYYKKVKTMKKSILTILIGISTLGYSQIVIGGEQGASGSDMTSVLLDFAPQDDAVSGDGRGIILPYVMSLPTTPTEGTLALDASTPNAAKVVYYNGTWVDLSNGNVGDVSSVLSVQSSQMESIKAKAIMGSDFSNADGVLILESTDKAMVLPQVTDVNDVVNPSPGMMVYLKNDKMLAVFNGNKWSFWKADM